MSQRLHIGNTEDTYFDCIINSDSNIRDKLQREWLMKDRIGWLEPWKIRIGDYNLFRRVEPIIREIISELKGRKYPDDIWFFYYGDKELEHPTDQELNDWLDNE